MSLVKNTKGFSLIELMVVVAIIGILSAIGIPQYSKFQAKARQSEAKTSLGALFTTEKSFQIEWTFFTRDLGNAGFGIEGTALRYNVGFPAVVADGAYLANGRPPEDPLRRVASGLTPTPNFAAAATPPGTDTYVLSNPASYGVATFVGSAWGSPNTSACATGTTAGTKCDEWTINQAKLLSNPQNGIW